MTCLALPLAPPTTERIYCNAQMSPRLIRKYCAIESQHVSKAIQYRTLDRNFWA
jgi:hypothetical protein